MTKQLRYHEDHDHLCDKYTIVKTYYNSLILLNYLSSGSPASSTVKSGMVETICIPLVWNTQKHPLRHAVPSNCPCIFGGQEDTSRQPNVRSVMSCITTIVLQNSEERIRMITPTISTAFVEIEVETESLVKWWRGEGIHL